MPPGQLKAAGKMRQAPVSACGAMLCAAFFGAAKIAAVPGRRKGARLIQDGSITHG